MEPRGYNAHFPLPLVAYHLPNGKDVALLEPFLFIDEKYGPIIVGAGRTTDFASTPSFIWAVLPPFGRYKFGAVIHDELYRSQKLGYGFFGWRRADRVLWRAMKFCPIAVPAWQRVLIYLGLLLGGWVAYTKAYYNRQHESTNAT